MDGYTVEQLKESTCSVLRPASYRNDCAWKAASTTCCGDSLPQNYYGNYDTCLQNQFAANQGTRECNPPLPS